MRYAVTLRGPRTAENPLGTQDVVIVEAESGDEAVEKAFQPYKAIVSVQPAPRETLEQAKPRKAKAN